MLALGDSKSAPDTQVWGHTLANMLTTSTNTNWIGLELGRGGYTVANLENNLDEDHDVYGMSIIAAAVGGCETSSSQFIRCQESLRGKQPTYVLINIGVNDVGFVPPWSLPDQTTWQNNYLSAIDQVHTAWPDALVGLTIPFKRQSGGDEGLFDAMAGWIANVQSARSAFVFVADDERSWFKPDITVYSDDGIHFNAAGQAAASAAKLAVLP